MRTPRCCTVALLTIPIALGTLAGCGDADARAQREAHRAIEQASHDLRAVTARSGSEVTPELREESRRLLGDIASRLDRLDGAAPGQQAAAALLRANVHTRKGQLEGDDFAERQNAHRLRRTELAEIAQAAAALSRLADAAERFDPQTERAMLEAVRTQTGREIEALRGRIGDLDRPLATLRADNDSNRTGAQALDAQERELRQDARAKGYAAGFPIFMTAIDRRLQANTMRIRMARNDIQIAELAPERALASVTMTMSEAMVEAIAAAESELQQGVEGAKARATALRSTAETLNRRALAVAEEIGAGLRGEVAESLQQATQELERAIQAASRAATTGSEGARESVAAARQAGATARQALASLYLSRLLDSRDVIASLHDGLVAGRAGSAAAVADAIREIRAQQQAVEAELKEPTRTAITGAIEAVTQLGERPAIIQARESLTRMLAAVDAPPVATTAGAGGTAGAGSGAGATGDAGAETPEAILAFLNDADPTDLSQLNRYLGLLRGTSQASRQLIDVLRISAAETAPLMSAMVEQFGAESLGEVPGFGAVGTGGGLRLADQTDRQATVVGAGLEPPLRLIRTGGRWYIDAESVVDAETMTGLSMAAGMITQVQPAMRAAATAVAQRVRGGEFATPEAAMEAFQAAVMAAAMEGAMGGADEAK